MRKPSKTFKFNHDDDLFSDSAIPTIDTDKLRT